VSAFQPTVQNLWPVAKHGRSYLPAAMSSPVPRHDPYASLRIPNFRWFIISLLTMNVATQL